MTPFETSQPDSVFNAAGTHAYMIGIFQSDNPYKLPKYTALWDAGYRFAKKLFEPAPAYRTRPNSSAPYIVNSRRTNDRRTPGRQGTH